jgi:integrase/recombinase XerD
MSTLADELTGFWSQEVWLSTEIPISTLSPIEKRRLKFTTHSTRLNNELKYAFKQLITTGQWSLTSVKSHQTLLKRLTEYINNHQSHLTSFMQLPRSVWEEQLIDYWVQKGYRTQNSQCHYVTKNGGQKTSILSQNHFIFLFRSVYQIIDDYYDTRDEWDKDRINVTRIGLNGQTRYFDLSNLQPFWLQSATRQFLRYHANHKSLGTLYKYLVRLSTFSRFLTVYYPSLTQPNELKREIIIDFIGKLRQNHLTENYIISILSSLNMFLTTCTIHGFADLPNKPLLYPTDFPKSPRPKPKSIPNDVHEQLMEQLPRLKEPYQTMLAVLEQTGARVSEVLGLSIHCLSRDPEGDYFLTRWCSKQRKSHSVPITAELAARIQSAARQARQKHGPKAKWLFGNKNDRPLSHSAFKQNLNKWAVQCDIRDQNGQIYIPHFHQFRHTVGTRMINNGVPQHLVKRYLGHDSIDMTSVYAHLSDDTAKKAVADFLSRSDQLLTK